MELILPRQTFIFLSVWVMMLQLHTQLFSVSRLIYINSLKKKKKGINIITWAECENTPVLFIMLPI